MSISGKRRPTISPLESMIVQAGRDRPFLMLFLASLWMDYGFPALDALLVNTKNCVGRLYCQLSCMGNKDVQCTCCFVVDCISLWSHSYSALVVSVTGQIPFNALVALHLFWGYSLARSAKNGGHGPDWDFFLACFHYARNKAFFFPLLSCFFLLYSSEKGWKKRFSRFFFFSLGSAPLIGILYWWQKMIWTHGRKYQDLISDLRLLHQEDTFPTGTQARFTLGKCGGDISISSWLW